MTVITALIIGGGGLLVGSAFFMIIVRQNLLTNVREDSLLWASLLGGCFFTWICVVAFRNIFRMMPLAFNPLERKLLSALCEALPHDAAKILREQLVACNSVQRLPPETMLYYTKWTVPVECPAPLFPRKDEIELASITFKVSGREEKWQARFIAVNGHLFSIIIRPSPKRITCFRSIEIIRVDLKDNPMIPPGSGKKVVGKVTIDELTGWVQEWCFKYGVDKSDIAAPLPTEEREEATRRIEPQLPVDYLELTQQTEGFVIGEEESGIVTVMGLSEAYEVHLHDANYLLLAALHCHGIPEWLGVKTGSRDGLIYLLEHDSNEPSEELGNSFKGAVEKYLGKNQREKGVGSV